MQQTQVTQELTDVEWVDAKLAEIRKRRAAKAAGVELKPEPEPVRWVPPQLTDEEKEKVAQQKTVIIKDLNHSVMMNTWAFQVAFPRPAHPVLSSMFEVNDGDVITRTISYQKWAMRQHIPQIETMTQKQAEEMLTVSLTVIDRAALLPIEEGWKSEADEQFNSENKQHQYLRHHYWDTIETWMDVFVRLRK